MREMTMVRRNSWIEDLGEGAKRLIMVGLAACALVPLLLIVIAVLVVRG